MIAHAADLHTAAGHNSLTAHTTHGQPHSVVTQLATRLILQLAAQMGTQTAIRIASRVVSDTHTHTRLPPMQVMIIMSRKWPKATQHKFSHKNDDGVNDIACSQRSNLC
jgi:hypothetical protein